MAQSGSSGRGGGAGTPRPATKRKKIAEMTDRIDPAQPETVLNFGASIQSQVAQFQDRVMSHVQAKDNRRVIELLDQLLGHLKTLDMSPVGTPSLSRRLRAWRKRLSWTELCLSDYRELGQRIERQIDELNDARSQLLSDAGVFDKLYEQNLTHLQNIGLRLQVLDSSVKQLETKDLPRVRRKLENQADPTFELQIQDMKDQIERLERRRRDLRLTREICMQNAAQIRMAQRDRQMLAERILDSVLNTVPLWKTQVSIALARSRQKEMQKLHQRIKQATQVVLDRNHAALGTLRFEGGGDALPETAPERPMATESKRLPPKASAPAAPIKPASGLEH
jgi:uncharacterized protein YaaN involved in tellurite resistance